MQSFSRSSIFSLNVFSIIISFCKFHIYSLSDQSYSQQNSSALYEKSVIISKLKDLKDIINYRLSCDVITLWAATAGGTAAARLRKTSQSVREQKQKQPLYEGNVARWYLFSTTATCRKVCLALWLFIDHYCWTSLSLSSDGSVQARQLHDYKESCLFLGQLCFFCTDKNSWKHQNCFCLTYRYKTHRHLSHLVKWNQLIIIR